MKVHSNNQARERDRRTERQRDSHQLLGTAGRPVGASGNVHRRWKSWTVVKLLSKRTWTPIGDKLERPKLEPEGPRAEVGFPTADQGFSSIRGTLFGFYGI